MFGIRSNNKQWNILKETINVIKFYTKNRVGNASKIRKESFTKRKFSLIVKVICRDFKFNFIFKSCYYITFKVGKRKNIMFKCCIILNLVLFFVAGEKTLRLNVGEIWI